MGSVAFDGKRLFTPDTYTNRVLGFARLPTRNGAAATFVIGQPSLWEAEAGRRPPARTCRNQCLPTAPRSRRLCRQSPRAAAD
jgi:hypothetical protein